MGSLSEIQQQIILGCILGDGYMRKKTNAHLQVTHSYKQKEYVDWKYQMLKNIVITPPTVYRGNANRLGYRFFTRSLPDITKLHDMFYFNKVKRISKVFNLTPLTIAVWYMDDGSKSGGSCYFNTQGFDIQSQYNLAKSLEKRGVKSTLNKDKQYYRIRIAKQSISNLIEMIDSNIIASMKYKIPR